MKVRTVEWRSGRVVMLDQRLLPHREVYRLYRDAGEVMAAIKEMVVRGAPAIGVAAAYGLAFAVAQGEDPDTAFETLATSRPTAVNLRWALEEMRADPSAERARGIHEAEVERCKRMSAHAVELFPAGARVLTHCNAGSLATGGNFYALREWDDAKWTAARDAIKTQNEKDKAQRG